MIKLNGSSWNFICQYFGRTYCFFYFLSGSNLRCPDIQSNHILSVYITYKMDLYDFDFFLQMSYLNIFFVNRKYKEHNSTVNFWLAISIRHYFPVCHRLICNSCVQLFPSHQLLYGLLSYLIIAMVNMLLDFSFSPQSLSTHLTCLTCNMFCVCLQIISDTFNRFIKLRKIRSQKTVHTLNCLAFLINH